MYTKINHFFITLLLSLFSIGLNESTTKSKIANSSEISTILRKAHPFLKTLHLTKNMVQFLDQISKYDKTKRLATSPSNQPKITTPQIYLVQKELLNYINKALSDQLVSTTKPPIISKTLSQQLPLNRRKASYLNFPATTIGHGFATSFSVLPNFNVSFNINLDKLRKRYMPLIDLQDNNLQIPNPNLPVTPNIGEMISLAAQLALSTPTPVNAANILNNFNLDELLKGSTKKLDAGYNQLMGTNKDILGELQLELSNEMTTMFPSFKKFDLSTEKLFDTLKVLGDQKFPEKKKVDDLEKLKCEAAKLNEAFKVIETAFKTTHPVLKFTDKLDLPTPPTSHENFNLMIPSTNKIACPGATEQTFEIFTEHGVAAVSDFKTPYLNLEEFGRTTCTTSSANTSTSVPKNHSTSAAKSTKCGKKGHHGRKSTGKHILTKPTKECTTETPILSSSSTCSSTSSSCIYSSSSDFISTTEASPEIITPALILPTTTNGEKLTNEEDDLNNVLTNSKNGKISRETLEEIRNEIGELKLGKYKGKKEGMPCCLLGDWVSDAAGVGFNVNKQQPVEFIVSITEVHGKCGFFRGLDWEVTAFMPFRKISFIIMTAIHQNDLRMATFSGECRVCDGNEFINGHWLVSKNESRCEEMSEAQEFFGDLWKRKT